VKKVVAASILVALMACTSASGHAERVDVPLRASITNVRSADGGPSGGSILSFHMNITNEGDGDVTAMACRATALDSRGRTLFAFSPTTGIGGTDVHRGQTTSYGTQQWVRADPKVVAAVGSYQASCQAYVWHGSRPI
jgi:hypothetical protein